MSGYSRTHRGKKVVSLAGHNCQDPTFLVRVCNTVISDELTFVHKTFMPAFLKPWIMLTVAFTTLLPAVAFELRPGWRKKSK